MLERYKIRILFFIGSLRAGGKERRLIELLTYLKDKQQFELMMVVTRDEVHYPSFFQLNIPYRVIIKKRKKNDFSIFRQFYNICAEFKPNLIHTWGSMQSFYTLPAIIGQRIPLVNSQITAAPPNRPHWSVTTLVDKLNFHFSKVILSNSKAGIDTYKPPRNKGRVIYNGLNLSRFEELPPREHVRAKYKIETPFAVVMSASFTTHKNYDLFFRVAECVTKLRDDVTFIGVGGYGSDETIYVSMLGRSRGNNRILFPGRISDVEALVNACTVGVLFSNKEIHGEGISNSILEYMALCKPVIANDAGGTREIVRDGKNGYLIVKEKVDEIVMRLLDLIDDKKKCQEFGRNSRRIIEELFTLRKMGKAFEQVYKEVLV